MTAYRLGYARVSTADQTSASQLDALHAAGCQEVFVDHVSGTTTDRPVLARLLERRRPGTWWCGAWTASAGRWRT